MYVFNESYELGDLSESQRKAVTSLIFKKDDQEDISNYRPIILTNVEYRILAFTLAERVQQVIGDLVSTDQFAYIRGRYIDTNIRLVNDIIEYYDLFSKSGILSTFDFTKAFDTLQWDFTFKSLQCFIRYDVHPSLQLWILNFLTNRTQYVKTSKGNSEKNLNKHWKTSGLCAVRVPFHSLHQ